MVAPRPVFSLGVTFVAIFIAVLMVILLKFMFFRKLKKPSDIFEVSSTDMFLGTIAKSNVAVFEELDQISVECTFSFSFMELHNFTQITFGNS